MSAADDEKVFADLAESPEWAAGEPQPEPEPEPAPEPDRPKKTRVRASRSKASAAGDRELESKLREPLLRIGEWLSRRDPELAQALKEDAPKMARLLARWAVNGSVPPAVVSAIRLLAAALEPVDAFARVIRLTVFRLYDWRMSKRPQPQDDYPAEQPADIVGDGFGEPEQPAQPPADDDFAEARARFAADAEPPVVND